MDETPAPLDLPGWRELYRAEPCESCRTFVAQVWGFVDPEADPAVAVRLWMEIVAWPEFGTQHTPERCRAVRGR